MDRIDDRIEQREALRWLARALAWEDRLAELRHGEPGPEQRRPLAA
jgi:hypothetical protein